MAVMQGMEAVVLVVGVWTFTVMEGTMILAERYSKRQFQAGKAEGMAEWAGWFRRRMQAEAEGRPFDEPPPSPIDEPSGTNGPAR